MSPHAVLVHRQTSLEYGYRKRCDEQLDCDALKPDMFELHLFRILDVSAGRSMSSKMPCISASARLPFAPLNHLESRNHSIVLLPIPSHMACIPSGTDIVAARKYDSLYSSEYFTPLTTALRFVARSASRHSMARAQSRTCFRRRLLLQLCSHVRRCKERLLVLFSSSAST